MYFIFTEDCVDCFKGQPNRAGIIYRIDTGIAKASSQGYRQHELFEGAGFKNSDLTLKESHALENIQHTQRLLNLP